MLIGVSESVNTFGKEGQDAQKLWTVMDFGEHLKDCKSVKNESDASTLPDKDLNDDKKNLRQDNQDLMSKAARLELENRRLNTNIGQIAANMSEGDERSFYF